MRLRSLAHVFHLFFFFNDTATTEIYTLSLHDALPIYGVAALERGAHPREHGPHAALGRRLRPARGLRHPSAAGGASRSEEHTAALPAQAKLACRLLLEKKTITRPLETAVRAPPCAVLS